MSNNRETRRKLARISGRRPASVKQNLCVLCCFIIDRIVANRAQDFKLGDGSVIPLLPMDRLLPPYGVRYPKTAARRHNCSCQSGQIECVACEGKGFIIEESACRACNGSGQVRHEACEGTGVLWELNDFAPLCAQCSQFYMVWLQTREQLHLMQSGQVSGRIVLPTGENKSIGGIVLPR